MYKIRMKTGGRIYPVTKNLLKHNEAEVVLANNNGIVGRVIDPIEYADMTIEEMNAESKPVIKEAVTAKKPAPKKKKANKPKAIPDEPASLENIDVSAL